MKNLTGVGGAGKSTALKNTVYRGEQTGRFLSLQYFVDDAFVEVEN